jgi:hypothetical protein
MSKPIINSVFWGVTEIGICGSKTLKIDGNDVESARLYFMTRGVRFEYSLSASGEPFADKVIFKGKEESSLVQIGDTYIHDVKKIEIKVVENHPDKWIRVEIENKSVEHEIVLFFEGEVKGDGILYRRG